MAENVAVQRGSTDVGQQQLPEGDATRLTEDTQVTPAEDQALADQPVVAPEAQAPAEVPVQMAQPGDNEPIYTPFSEEEAFLTGPTGRPAEDQSMGAHPREPIPAKVLRALPFLQKAASSPNADPKLVTLVSFLLREVGKGN